MATRLLDQVILGISGYKYVTLETVYDKTIKLIYWKSNPEWYEGDPYWGPVKLTDKAPPEAVESFKFWLRAE